MSITICQLADFRLGRQAVTGTDFHEAKLPLIGGCQVCHATIACYNAYPSITGFLRCEMCIGDMGYATVEEANLDMFGDIKENPTWLEAFENFLSSLRSRVLEVLRGLRLTT